MSWYLCDEKSTSNSLTDDQARRAICDHFCRYSSSAKGLESLLPKWQRLSQAIFMALMAGFCGYFLVCIGLDMLFGFRYLYFSMAFLGANLLLFLVLLCWGWGGVWCYASRRRHWLSARKVRIIKIVAVLGLLFSIALVWLNNRNSFYQLPTWVQTFKNETEFSFSEDKTTLILTGVIGRETPRILSKKLRENPTVQVVRLHLQGGLVEEARQMYQIIESYALNTEVTEECSSACTIVFMAGRGRKMASGAKIGFHRYHYVQQEDFPQADLVEQAYLISLGIPSEFVVRVFASDNVWYPEVTELREANIVTGQVVEKGDGSGIEAYP